MKKLLQICKKYRILSLMLFILILGFALGLWGYIRQTIALQIFLLVLCLNVLDIPGNFFIFLGGSIISGLIYNRLILEKFPKEIFIDIAFIQVLIYFCIFISSFFMVIHNTKLLVSTRVNQEIDKTKKLKLKFVFSYFFSKIEKIHESISSFFYKCFHEFDSFVKKWIIIRIFQIDLWNIFIKINKIHDYITKNTIDITLAKYQFMLFVIFPRIIILMSLLVDVFIFEILYYFYVCAPLYMLIWLYNYYIITFTQISKEKLETFNDSVEVLHPDEEQKITLTEYIDYHIGKSLLLMNRAITRKLTIYTQGSIRIFFDASKFSRIQADKFTEDLHNIYRPYCLRLKLLSIVKLTEYLIVSQLVFILQTLVWGYLFTKGLIIYLEEYNNSDIDNLVELTLETIDKSIVSDLPSEPESRTDLSLVSELKSKNVSNKGFFMVVGALIVVSGILILLYFVE